MAQSGFHGLIGIALAKTSFRKAKGLDGVRAKDEEAGAFTFGLVAGNVLPDADLLPLAITYLFNPALAMRMHRTATHSLLVIGVLTLFGYALAKNRHGKRLVLGLCVGAVAHCLVDIFLWFSPVDILWPLGHLGLPSEINLWKGVTTPRVVGNLLGAADFLALALFTFYLEKLGQGFETDVSFLPTLRKITLLHSAAFGVFFSASFFLSATVFQIAQYALFLLVSSPIVVYAMFKSKNTIERLAF